MSCEESSSTIQPISPVAPVGSSTDVTFLGRSNPIRSMVSSQNPLMLEPGFLPLVENFRIGDGGLPVVTPGTQLAYSNAGLPAGAMLGSYMGEEGIFMAIGTSPTECQVWYYDEINASWVQITGTSGVYGSTVGTSGTAMVAFTVVREPMIKDMQVFTDPADTYIIWQNGIDLPRVANTRRSYLIAKEVAIIAPIEAPNFESCSALPTWRAYFNIRGTVTPTHSNAAHIEASTTTEFGQSLKATVKTAVVNNSFVQFQFPTIAVPDDPLQLHIVFQCLDLNIFSRMKVVLVDTSGAEYTISDPTDSGSAPLVTRLVSNTGVFAQSAFSLYRVKSGAGNIAFPAGNYNRIKFIWSGVAPALETPILIHAIGFSGQVQYGARFAVTYFCGGAQEGLNYREGAGPRTESAPAYTKIERTPTIVELGGSDVPGLHLAESAGFRYVYTIRFNNPKNISALSPITHLLIYSKTVGSVNYTLSYWNPLRIGRFSGGAWGYSQLGQHDVLSQIVNAENKTSRIVPTTGCLPLPPGDMMLWNGNRAFVANSRLNSATTGVGEVAISERNRPFRFGALVRAENNAINPDHATVSTYPGGSVKALVAASESPVGADGIFVFTTQGRFSIDSSSSVQLSNARWLGNTGTLASRSVVVYRGSVIALDSNLQVQRWSYEWDTPSENMVEDWLEKIPDQYIKNACAVVFGNRLHLAICEHDAIGGAQSRVLVYDFRRGAWTTDKYPFDIRQWHVLSTGSKQKLFAVHADRTIHRYELPSVLSFSGADVISKLVFPTIASGGADSVAIDDLTAQCQSAPGTMTLTVSALEDATINSSGTLNMFTAGKAISWKYFMDGTNHLGLSGDGLVLTLVANAKPGTTIYSIIGNVKLIAGGANSE